MAETIPTALTIAGVDPSGGAGVLADVKAFSALGAYACAVIAALTAQNTRTVAGVLPIAPDFIARQIDTLFADVRIDAIKIGMLGEAAVIATVADRLAAWKAQRVVLDPVMVAKSGDALLASSAVGALREALVPLANVMTPNLPEAGVLLESRAPETVKEMTRAAERLHGLMGSGERWVWLKGGHLPSGDATDLLFNGDRMIEISRPRMATRNTHGTGCTLSAALAALLPQRPDVPTAAQDAKDYLTEALRQADKLQIGQGHGPVHHFHALWRAEKSDRR
jgi:hydroxymethylpyrimidine/phosphomethylpyrimidine kinase